MNWLLFLPQASGWLKDLLAWITAFLALFGTGGCAGWEGVQTANPTTIVRVQPETKSIYVQNNKDVNVSVRKLEVDPATGRFVIDDLVIADLASPVRAVNVQQIKADSERQLAIGRAWQQVLAGAATLLTAGIPILGGMVQNPVWGAGMPGAVPQGWQYVGPPSAPLAPALPPSPQPATGTGP